MEFFGLVHLPMYVRAFFAKLFAKKQKYVQLRFSPNLTTAKNVYPEIKRLHNQFFDYGFEYRVVIAQQVNDINYYRHVWENNDWGISVASRLDKCNSADKMLFSICYNSDIIENSNYEILIKELIPLLQGINHGFEQGLYNIKSLQKTMLRDIPIDKDVRSAYVQLANVLKDSHSNFAYHLDSFLAMDKKLRLLSIEQRAYLTKFGEDLLVHLQGNIDTLTKEEREQRDAYMKQQAELQTKLVSAG